MTILQFAREPREALAGGAGDGLGQIEQIGVFFAAEILRAEQFLHADDLRPSAGGFADAPLGFGQISLGSTQQAIWTRPMRNLAACTNPF